MKVYKQLSLQERIKLSTFLQMGKTTQEIARRLKRHRSTIYRELKRNRLAKSYSPDVANDLSQARRQDKPCKLKQDSRLYDFVLKRLRLSWSPEQIAGRLRYLNKPYSICAESIYRYIYRRGNKGLYRYLARSKPYRGKRYGRKPRLRKYKHIRLIHERPSSVSERSQIGHWEGDTIAFSSSNYENVSTWVERKSRYTRLFKHANRQTETVMGCLEGWVKNGPKKLWKTLTLDQGSEFADYRRIERGSRCQVYYCEPHSPWQRGSNENMNGRLRRYLPRNLEIESVTQDLLDELEKRINNLPRKCLGYMTPKEVLLRDCPSACRTSM